MTEPSAREPQQDRSRATRARLLEAAVDCLADVGWSASTVATVAERAGMSRGAAQHHFATREALFIAAVEHVSVERAAAIRSSIEAGPSVRPDTQAVVEQVVDLHTGPLFRAALTLWVASASEPQLRDLLVPLEAKIGREMHRATVELLDADESAPGVRAAVQATLDLARGLGLAALLTDDRRRRAPIVAQWSAMLDAVLTRTATGQRDEQPDR